MQTNNDNQGASSESIENVREARQTRLLKILLFMSVIYTLYLAKTLFVPLAFSAFIALLLSPLVAIARKFYIPRGVSAVVLIGLLVTPFTLLGIQLVQPAERWMERLPTLSAEVTEHIDEISEKFENKQTEAKEIVNKKTEEEKGFSLFGWFDDEEEQAAPPKPPTKSDNEQSTVSGKIKQGSLEVLLETLAAAPFLIAQLLGSIILILFLLVFGPSLFQIFVQDFPVVNDKKRAILLVSQIQRRLSNYILTISMVNGLLGAVTATVFFVLGIDDALLWGALVGLLNFVPYLGGMVSTTILVVAGAVQFGLVSMAFFPAAVFLAINIIESQFVTPAVLGKQFRLNPLIIIVWLGIMGWLWGVAGALLAVPILVCAKIILEHLGIKTHWVKFLESSG
mgnify:CR=1 FL=1